MSPLRFLTAPIPLVMALLVGCPRESPPDEPPPEDPWQEVALEAPQGYLDRKAEYLEYCHANNGPGQGGLYGQLCRVARGDSIHTEAIDEACAKVDAREDTADFTVAALVRLLYLDRANPSLDDDVRTQVEETVLGFKYWIDEPGADKMCYWSENHQALFHSNELLAGQLFPEQVFPNADMTGLDHVVHAERMAHRWLDFRGRLGFSEWHSNVYFNEDIPALVNLADFAEDGAIRVKAAAALDLIAFDLLNNMYDGHFATPHGRTYENKFLDGLSDSTGEAAWIMTGLGNYESTGNFSGTFLATADGYFTPGVLEEIAAATEPTHEHRQRDGIDVVDGPTWGVGYEDPDDIIFWAGMVGLVAPEVIEGTVDMLDELDLWDGFLFGDLPPEATALLDMAVANDSLVDLATDLEPLSRGIALESMNTYVYRTPHYQLAGAQDYNPGYWGAQTQAWQATLDGDAYVFTSFPSEFGLGDAGMTFATDWTGSWFPRATFHRNVGVIQYQREPVALVDTYLTSTHTHAYVPRERFDEFREEGNWVLGRKGDGYVALYSAQPTTWSEDNDYELDAEGEANVWVVELGSADEHGDFDAFADAILGAHVETTDGVVYESPSLGTVEVDWEGPLTVAGEPIDLGPYPRWDNPYARTDFGSPVTHVDMDDLRLELDFETPARRLLEYRPQTD